MNINVPTGGRDDVSVIFCEYLLPCGEGLSLEDIVSQVVHISSQCHSQ